MAKVSVIGAGSWGTALALLLSKNGHDVTMWSILEDEIRMLDKEREHKSKLPGVKLPDTMKFTTDLKEKISLYWQCHLHLQEEQRKICAHM